MPPEPLTIAAAAPLIRAGDLTPSDLLEQCLARVDIYEPAVKAWVFLDRDRARRDAAVLTDELKRGHHRGPLHGIPVGIKDIIDVFDMPTGCGSKLWATSYARRDATCVERLRQAGAVILGKTVTTPYAFTDPPVTRNPWNLDRTPGGSSSGSAAAVACGMCLAALGTQTGGSLTRPASYCGVCSLKPTHGRVSVDGVLPLAPSLDHVGVIAGCVRDLFTVYRSQIRKYYHYEDELAVRPGLDWLPRLDDDPIPPPSNLPVKLFVTPKFDHANIDSAVRLGFWDFVSKLPLEDNSGIQVWTTELSPTFETIPEHHRTRMSVEAAVTHRERFARHPDDYPPRIAALIEEGLKCSAVRYAEAESREWYSMSSEVGLAFRDGVLVTPAAPNAAPTRETTGDPILNVPWSFLGLPTVSIPVGRTADGMPIAVQFVGPNRFKDVRVLSVAAVVEQIVNFPRTLPPVPVGA